MSYGPISHTYTMLDSASANSSTYTTNPVLVADWRQITVSTKTAGTGASRYTIWATDAEGQQSAIAEADWSAITAIVAQGLYTIDPGMRWLRATRSAVDSTGTIIFAGRT